MENYPDRLTPFAVGETSDFIERKMDEKNTRSERLIIGKFEVIITCSKKKNYLFEDQNIL